MKIIKVKVKPKKSVRKICKDVEYMHNGTPVNEFEYNVAKNYLKETPDITNNSNYSDICMDDKYNIIATEMLNTHSLPDVLTQWRDLSLRQILEILDGYVDGSDISFYADSKFEADQMHIIHLGLLQGINPYIYCNPEYTWKQMDEIRQALVYDIDPTPFADPKYNYVQMKEIRLGLMLGLDVTNMLNPSLHDSVMNLLRKVMIRNKYMK